MMFWRIGAILFLFRWIFGDPKVDVRFLVAGAVLPDVIDLTIEGPLTRVFRERDEEEKASYNGVIRYHAPGAIVLQADPQVCLGCKTGHALWPFDQAHAVVEVRPAQEFELIGGGNSI